MKLLLAPLALFLLFPHPSTPERETPPRETIELRWAPEEGTVLTRTFEAEASYRLTDITASVDGEELERGAELPDYGMSFQEHVVVTDTLRSIAGGRPTELLRTFDELSQENTDSVAGEDSERSFTSPFEGRTVLFRWDEDEEAYAAESADDEDLDEDLAAWLAEDMDLRGVLPPGEVEVGDEWELEPELYLAFMWPGGLLDWRTDEEEPGEEERDQTRQTIEHLEGSGSVRLEELREVDGVRMAVLHLEMELQTGSERILPALDDDELEEGQFPRPAIRIEVEIERKLEGTLLWDLEHGHAFSADLACESTRLQSESWTVTGEHEGEEVSADIEQARMLEGTIHYTVTIERQ